MSPLFSMLKINITLKKVFNLIIICGKIIGKVVGNMGIDNTIFSGCALYGGTILNCIFRKQSYLK